jgi:hypothetical protein
VHLEWPPEAAFLPARNLQQHVGLAGDVTDDGRNLVAGDTRQVGAGADRRCESFRELLEDQMRSRRSNISTTLPFLINPIDGLDGA